MTAGCSQAETSKSESGQGTKPKVVGPAFVLFYTENWAPWEEFAPIVNGLEDEYGESINFYRFDANDPDNQRLQNDLQLRGHPSVAIVKSDGDISNRFFGSQSAELLRPVLDELNNE